MTLAQKQPMLSERIRFLPAKEHGREMAAYGYAISCTTLDVIDIGDRRSVSKTLQAAIMVHIMVPMTQARSVSTGTSISVGGT